MQDTMYIDISTDTHVKRVMKRTILIRKEASNEEIVCRAREINPEYPGIIDIGLWLIGREWCSPNDPNCTECILAKYCPKSL